MVPPRRHGLLLELRRPAPLSPRPRPGAAADHARAARARLGALRRRPREPRRAADRVRARDPRGRRAGERARGAARRRRGRGARARVGPRLLLVPAAQPGRRHARLDLLGPPEHAVGRHRALGGAAGRRPARRAWWPAARASRSGSRSGARTACSTSCPTASGWWNLYREDAQLTDERGRARLPAVGLRRIELRVPRRRRHRVHPGGRRLRAPLHPARGRDRPGGPRPSLHRRRLPRAAERRRPRDLRGQEPGRGGGRGQLERARRRARPVGRRRARARAGVGARAQGDRVPERRRSHRARVLVPAHEPRLRGAAGRATADHRAEPRRAHRPRDPGVRLARSPSGRAAGSASWT